MGQVYYSNIVYFVSMYYKPTPPTQYEQVFHLCRMEMARVMYHWTHRWSKTYQQTIFFNTMQPKEGPPFNLTFFKGELHGLFSRRMVQYIVESEISQRYLEWCWDTGHPSEHYWNVLNYNVHLHAPGSYEGKYKYFTAHKLYVDSGFMIGQLY